MKQEYRNKATGEITKYPQATKVQTKAERNWRRQQHFIKTGERPLRSKLGKAF